MPSHSRSVEPASRGRERQGKGPSRLRMKDLMRETGLSRETIHFYIAEGLVPAGKRTSRTTSEYTQAHVERLRWIQRLREEQFLPLRAVKALLRDESGGKLTGRQRLFLRRADAVVSTVLDESHDVPLTDVDKGPLTRRDLDVLEENSLIEIKRVGRRRMVSSDDAEIVEAFARLREAGFTRERGYTGKELVLFDRTMDQLVQREYEVALEHLEDQTPQILRSIFDRSNPFLEHLILVMRRKAFRRRTADGEQSELS